MYPASHAQSDFEGLPGGELACDGQRVQLPVPFISLYSPAAHAVHATPTSQALYPRMQVQSSSATLARAEVDPAGQVLHVAFPTPTRYCPAAHAWHVDPSEDAVYLVVRLGFGAWGVGFGILGMGSGVWGLGFGVWSLGLRFWGLGFGFRGLGSRV